MDIRRQGGSTMTDRNPFDTLHEDPFETTAIFPDCHPFHVQVEGIVEAHADDLAETGRLF
jgi:hypothetical protein